MLFWDTMYITKIKVIPMTSPHIINDRTAVLCTPLTCIIPLLLVVPNIVLYRGNATTHVSVCLSVTLVYCDYWSWHASKISTRLIAVDHDSPQPQAQRLSLWEVPQFSDERVEWKGDFSVDNQKSLKQCDMEQNLQQNVSINLYIPYRLVTYSMTSRDL